MTGVVDDGRGGPASADGLLWHYPDGPGLFSILAGNVVWATASGYLNDTSEEELGNRLILERFTALADARHPVVSVLRERLEGSDAKRGPHRPGSSSASATPHSLAMWRTYGGRGESYAIGLDPSADLTVLVDDVAAAEGVLVRQHDWMPVRYDRAEQLALVDAVLAELPEGLDAFPDTLAAAEQALLLIKHPGFREEQETRRTTTVLGAGTRAEALTGLARFRHPSQGMAPYLRLTGASDAAVGVTPEPAALPIRAVAVSPTPNGDAAAGSLLALSTSHGMPQFTVRRSGIPFGG